MEEERAQGESLRVMGRGLNLGLTKVTLTRVPHYPSIPVWSVIHHPVPEKTLAATTRSRAAQRARCVSFLSRDTCSEEASAGRVAWKSTPDPVPCPPALAGVGMGTKEPGKILRLAGSGLTLI